MTAPSLIDMFFILVEIVMRNIAQLPRLLLTANPIVAQRIDDMLRAKILTTLQGVTFYALAMLSFFQLDILSHNFQTIQSPLLKGAIAVVVVIGCIGVLLPTALRDRIGGVVTEWPWQQLGEVQ